GPTARTRAVRPSVPVRRAACAEAFTERALTEVVLTLRSKSWVAARLKIRPEQLAPRRRSRWIDARTDLAGCPRGTTSTTLSDAGATTLASRLPMIGPVSRTTASYCDRSCWRRRVITAGERCSGTKPCTTPAGIAHNAGTLVGWMSP